MKRALFIVAALLIACGDVGAQSFYLPPQGKTGACMAGYIRAAPGHCRYSADGGASSALINPWTDTVACTQQTFTPALPTGVRRIELEVIWTALANAIAGNRANDLSIYESAGCTGTSGFNQFSIYEQAAVAAGTVIAKVRIMVPSALCLDNTLCVTQSNAGGNGNADILAVRVLSYYDD